MNELSTRLATLSALLLFGCATDGPIERDVAEPAPYDDLLRYVPTRMESVLAFDVRAEAGWPRTIQEHYADSVQRGVFAGRAFRFGSGFGAGPFDGVMIIDAAGTGPVLDSGSEPTVTAFRVGETEVRRFGWTETATQGAPFPFFAEVAPKRWVYASTADLMRESLAANSAGGAELAVRMGLSGSVDWDCPFVLLRRPAADIPDAPSESDRRSALWVRTRTDESARLRVSELTLRATDPDQLEFELQARCNQPIPPAWLDDHPFVWEKWGGPEFEGAVPTLDGDVLRLHGHLRGLFSRESPAMGTLIAIAFLGVRVFI